MKLFGIEDAFKFDQGMAWDFAALAAMHLSAAGCYRVPDRNSQPVHIPWLSPASILQISKRSPDRRPL